MPIHLSFHGAARIVTGSCFLLETGAGKVLIDCGMFQGPKSEKELNYRPLPFRPEGISAVILSHAHIDHAGLLPKLTKAGYRGPIYATPATVDLAEVMLPDSGYIQELEVEQLNKRNLRRGMPAVEPIYGVADARACIDHFKAVPYATWFTPVAGVRARFWNAGHLLGSASIEVEATPSGGGEAVRILFSADIGPDHKLLEPDPTGPAGIDYLLCESTYGDVDRIDATDAKRREVLRQEVSAAIRPYGALLIPSFAVERAQELISDLVRLMDEGKLPPIPIHIDSPLATRATEVFAKHARELEEGERFLRGVKSRHVRFTESVQQSKALDRLREFHIVIAASGMAEAGRIRHRLRNWLWREEATVLLVGFQAQGTLGRILKEGAPMVRIQGDEVQVRARIRSIDLYSGHADGPELVRWIEERQPVRHQIFLIHGEQHAMDGLQQRLAAVGLGDKVVMPTIDQRFELTATGARAVGAPAPPRAPQEKLGRPDMHNETARLMLDIDAAIDKAADERSRAVLIRRLRRALEGQDAA